MKPNAIEIARKVLTAAGADLDGAIRASIGWDRRVEYVDSHWEGYVLVEFELSEDPNAFEVILYLEGSDVRLAAQHFAGDFNVLVEGE